MLLATDRTMHTNSQKLYTPVSVAKLTDISPVPLTPPPSCGPSLYTGFSVCGGGQTPPPFLANALLLVPSSTVACVQFLSLHCS